ncbi:MAG: hypothetical protein FWC50_07925 [Planctomycetaceae bacterium]|nr:hypothetical protein [Planctomycetaceae bacterium]
MDDKEKLVAKFGLRLENGKWYSKKENAHPHVIFKDGYYRKTDLIGLVCRINKRRETGGKLAAGISNYIFLTLFEEKYRQATLW